MRRHGLAFAVLFGALGTACLPLNQVRYDPAPKPIMEDESEVVAIFSDTTCNRLDKSGPRGNGFFKTADIVYTVSHFFDECRAEPPNFAILDKNNRCLDGKMLAVDWNEDVLFIRTHRHHGTGLIISDEPIQSGKVGYVYSFVPSDLFWYTAADLTRPFSRTRHQVIDSPYNSAVVCGAHFASIPPAHKGDSGSAMLNETGQVIGMVQMIDRMIDPNYGIYLKGAVLKGLWERCKECHEIKNQCSLDD